MSEWEELASLIADARALLLLERARGVLGEDPDAPLPPPDLEAAAEEGPGAEEIAAAPPPPAPTVGAWAEIAAEARAKATPMWAASAPPPAATSAPSPDGVGAEGLAQIRADLGDCTRCVLCKGRTNIVFGVGDADADLMVIGEGPGEQEDLRGEPFVGPAGQMLDRMLANVLGLPRERVYIANVVKCRPPGNRNPEPDEAAACKPFLERQIQAVRPKLILLLGSQALQYVLGVSGIKRHRGRETVHRGIPVLPTFHPAYLLRVPDDKKLAFEDLKQARERYDALGGRR